MAARGVAINREKRWVVQPPLRCGKILRRRTMKTITIIGGGLAGLTLGIGLRQRDVPVQVIEAGHYPRHRVCGEFISGNGLETLERLGLRKKLVEAGAIPAQSAAFFSERKQTLFQPLPKPALCLSRYTL